MTTETMEITITKIGIVDDGIDGSDEYVLLVRKDDDLTPEQAIEFLLPRYYSECRRPGGYFCTAVRAVQVQYSANRVICTVEHRYDV
jgi:hypothetical protein